MPAESGECDLAYLGAMKLAGNVVP